MPAKVAVSFVRRGGPGLSFSLSPERHSQIFVLATYFVHVTTLQETEHVFDPVKTKLSLYFLRMYNVDTSSIDTFDL